MSFNKLMERAKTENPDGWGSVFYRGADAYVFREPRPGGDSPLARNLSQCGIPSQIVISHIRKATQGEVSLRNTHPFTRELHGKIHSFAFNGDVPDAFGLKLQSDRYMPIGTTDAEHAYCYLLDLLAAGDSNDTARTASILHAFGKQLAGMGPANFLYSDSLCLYVFASRRRHPDGEYPPGIYMLARQCSQIPELHPYDGLEVESTNALPQEIALFSSVPLSDEAWIPMPENQLLMVKDGQVLKTLD